MTCALPPLDMRFARVVAKTSRGLDMVYFNPDGTPRIGPVVAPLAGIVADSTSFSRLGYRNPLLLHTEAGYLLMAGFGFGGSERPRVGQSVATGQPIGEVDDPTRFSPEATAAFRRRDVTVGVDPLYPYLTFSVWSERPRVREWVTIRGVQWVAEGGRVANPVTWWRSQGYELVGPSRSETLEVVAGGPSDPSRCA